MAIQRTDPILTMYRFLMRMVSSHWELLMRMCGGILARAVRARLTCFSKKSRSCGPRLQPGMRLASTSMSSSNPVMRQSVSFLVGAVLGGSDPVSSLQGRAHEAIL